MIWFFFVIVSEVGIILTKISWYLYVSRNKKWYVENIKCYTKGNINIFLKNQNPFYLFADMFFIYILICLLIYELSRQYWLWSWNEKLCVANIKCYMKERLKPLLSLSTDIFLPILCSNAKSKSDADVKTQYLWFLLIY